MGITADRFPPQAGKIEFRVRTVLGGVIAPYLVVCAPVCRSYIDVLVCVVPHSKRYAAERALTKAAMTTWGKINSMPQIDQELNQLTYHFTAWAVGINVRLEAIETLIRSKLAVTEEEWDSAAGDDNRLTNELSKKADKAAMKALPWR
jgi:hypothetical protein